MSPSSHARSCRRAPTILEDGDLMLDIESPPDHGAVVVGARSLAQALLQACHLLEQ
jgi:hypothetical protein